jgi:hypothetical protein
LEWRKSMIECRGIYYQAVKEVFPHITEILTPELAVHFEGQIDPEAWYDARPYLATVGYLIEHISPDFMALLGGHLAEIAKDNFEQFGVDSSRKLAAILPQIYRNNVRGEDAGEWLVEEYKPGRAIIRETAITANVDFVSGVLRGGLEAMGAYNIRVSVLDERNTGADANRYLVEWIEPPGSPD